MQVLGVLKTFIWKAKHNILPSKHNLKKKNIIDNFLCPIYEREEETTCHALWSCGASNDVRAENVSPIKKWSSSEEDFHQI